MLRALNFKIVPEMCREQGREKTINDSYKTIHVSKPNKVSKDRPFKKLIKTAGGASQDTNHGLIGKNSGPKCSSITVEEHDENLPLLSKCCQTLFRI